MSSHQSLPIHRNFREELMPNTFPITIDATALSNAAYLIMDASEQNLFPPTSTQGLGWTANTQAYTVEMALGDYLFQIGSAEISTFHFQVSSIGTINYAAEFASFLSGEGTSELRVLGYKVQIDARYITADVVWSSNQVFTPTPISLSTFTLIPSPDYGLSDPNESSDMDWGFGLDGNGKFTYKPEFDYANGGFLEGQGTSTLVLLGYPLLVDARNAGGAGVRVVPGTGVPFATSGVTYVNMLPEILYTLQFQDGVASLAQFKLTDAGEIIITQELPWELSIDSFHPHEGLTTSKGGLGLALPVGVPRLTVNRVLLTHPTLDTKKSGELVGSKS
jgi:hypothetical protein